MRFLYVLVGSLAGLAFLAAGLIHLNRAAVTEMFSDSLLQFKYLEAVSKEYPMWFDSRINPTPPQERFHFKMTEMEEALRDADADPNTAAEVVSHLLDVWPRGFLSYNAWYTIHQARTLGLLDKNFRPNKEVSFINEELRQMEELKRLGGQEAVDAYKRIMSP